MSKNRHFLLAFFVKRPEGTKIYRQRDCVYVYHVTGSEYKKIKNMSQRKGSVLGKWQIMKISELLESIHGEEGDDLIKDLISYMIIRETSAIWHYSDFVWGHLVNSEKKRDDI